MSNLSIHKYLLYAEDDPDDQKDMQHMLRDIDPSLRMICFNNGLELMHHVTGITLSPHNPFCIVLDVNMPIWDGIRTLQALKADERYRYIPVIIFSTSTLQKDIDLALRLEAHAFVTKPIQHNEWVSVKQHLAAYFQEFEQLHEQRKKLTKTVIK